MASPVPVVPRAKTDLAKAVYAALPVWTLQPANHAPLPVEHRSQEKWGEDDLTASDIEWNMEQ